ncbi:MAG TPA: response regulator [Anaerolineales bacterium]|nr:response regulator [Anaerolineales bacterium]
MSKILVVEDHPDNAELVERVLTARGYQVYRAEDAETGLQMALDHQPDLILLDLGLPDADGQTLVGWMRREPSLANVPIIACTAWPEETARQMVTAYGCNGYIRKPINVAKFADEIAAYLR